MVSPTTIRSCSACLIRRRPIMTRRQQGSPSLSSTIPAALNPPSNAARSTISTLVVKPPKRMTLKSRSRTPLPQTTTRGTGGPPTATTTTATTTVSRTLKSSSRTSAAGQRRKATLAGVTGAAAGTAAPAARRKVVTRKELLDSLGEMLGQPRTIPIPRWVTPKHYSITLSECCGHASFILVAISYAVDDFLQLRIMAVLGSTSMLFFAWFHPHGRILWLPFKWNCLFIAINSYRIGRVYWDRYLSEQLSDELRETRSKHFYLMDPVDFGRLARLGIIESYKKGDIIMQQDQPNHLVRVVLSGGLKVMRDDKITYTLEEGNFVSECGLHAGLMLPDSVDSCCKILAESDVRLLAWDRSELVDLLNRSPHVRRSLKAVLSWDIVRKLKGQRLLLSDGIIHDAEAWTQRRHEQTEHRYTAILKNLLSTHDQREMMKRKQELTKYRTIHHIDDEHHRETLKECGWTVEEFEQGYKNDDNDDGDSSTNQRTRNSKKSRYGPDWYVREVIMRIVG